MRLSLFLVWLAVLVFAASAFAQKPVIQTVQNAASQAAGLPWLVAPQMLVTIRGENLASSAVSANSPPLPTILGGTLVLVNGIAAPLFYVSPKQLNLQVPGAVNGGANASIVVTTAAGSSDPVSVPVAYRALGIFTQDASGCGHAVAYNIHPDASFSMNAPENSLDPQRDLGLMILLTGVGFFPDRTDGAPWTFNPADNSLLMTAMLGIAGINKFQNPQILSLNNISYAGPAPARVGVDQVNALFSQDLNGRANAPEGCRIPLFLTDAEFVSAPSTSQFVGVSIHNGGGACVDPPADSLATVMWKKNFTSDVNSSSSSESVAVQFLSGSAIEFPPVPQIGFSASGALLSQPAGCESTGPATMDAGTLTISGPGFSPIIINPKRQNGAVNYDAVLPSGTIRGGNYSVVGYGGTAVGRFTSTAHIPAPITITSMLLPGTYLDAFTVNWTGGDSQSTVTIRAIIRFVGNAVALQATVPASQGQAALGRAPCQGIVPGFCPTGDVEIIVTHQPAAQPDTFAAKGLTLGGEQTWSYVWDFRGLNNR